MTVKRIESAFFVIAIAIAVFFTGHFNALWVEESLTRFYDGRSVAGFLAKSYVWIIIGVVIHLVIRNRRGAFAIAVELAALYLVVKAFEYIIRQKWLFLDLEPQVHIPYLFAWWLDGLCLLAIAGLVAIRSARGMNVCS